MPTEPSPKEEPKPDQPKSLEMPPQPVVTRHEIAMPSGSLEYEATFGLMPIRNQKGDIEAALSFTAYTAGKQVGGDPERPLTFLFNGGPGSSSVWLHMGGLGPRRVDMMADGGMPRPPFRVIDNPFTWLEFSDLVFIDPVDTGYSKAANDELRAKFLCVDGDLDVTGEFIRRYLTRFNRWSSPLFIGGESYGTFRVAGLAGKLLDLGIIFNGIILVSSVLELGTLLFESGDDLPYVLYLPSYAAAAWYHQMVAPEILASPLEELLAEVETWTQEIYAVALSRGDQLSGQTRQEIIERLARYTGIDAALIDRWNLRINGPHFCNELLAAERKTVGRLDSRHTGFDPRASSDDLLSDPSMTAIRPPFTAALYGYLRNELGYESDDDYHILRSLDWTWGKADEGTPRTTKLLESAFASNPYLHLLVTSGFYDLATPYFATHYTLGRLNVPPGARRNIEAIEYPGGHMIYVAADLMARMQTDVSAFVTRALSAENQALSPGGPTPAQDS